MVNVHFVVEEQWSARHAFRSGERLLGPSLDPSCYLDEHAFELSDAALRLVRSPLFIIGLPPQSVVAPEQQLEEWPALIRVLGEWRNEAPNANERHLSM